LQCGVEVFLGFAIEHSRSERKRAGAGLDADHVIFTVAFGDCQRVLKLGGLVDTECRRTAGVADEQQAAEAKLQQEWKFHGREPEARQASVPCFNADAWQNPTAEAFQ